MIIIDNCISKTVREGSKQANKKQPMKLKFTLRQWSSLDSSHCQASTTCKIGSISSWPDCGEENLLQIPLIKSIDRIILLNFLKTCKKVEYFAWFKAWKFPYWNSSPILIIPKKSTRQVYSQLSLDRTKFAISMMDWTPSKRRHDLSTFWWPPWIKLRCECIFSISPAGIRSGVMLHGSLMRKI